MTAHTTPKQVAYCGYCRHWDCYVMCCVGAVGTCRCPDAIHYMHDRDFEEQSCAFARRTIRVSQHEDDKGRYRGRIGTDWPAERK